eukprot:TRINITY_DN111719_c0_g1_i1.p1 TRINITY_DN111719_c0_g1~~TRINITY_DN111719_c0_g1_i1.p1  ORF type:complete len:210 (+),score=33.18 TRINITY_DN111719_c0_g1_i1:101-730(+)
MCTCSHDEEWPEDSWNLYQHIERVEALNILGGQEQGRGVFKPHARRLEPTPCIVSDADEELILKVWFIAPVNIRRICIASVGGDEEPESHPSSVRCFAGPTAEGLGFDNMEGAQPAQTLQIAMNPQAELFSHCSSRTLSQITFLLLHFPGNHGDLEKTRISYIGLQGEHSHAKRQAVNCDFELIPTADEKNEAWKQLGLDKTPGFGSMH